MADHGPPAAHPGGGKIDIPGVGKVKPVYAGAGLAAVAVLIILYYRRKNSAGSTTAAAQQTDPAGNTGPIDPATGYVFGSPEDVAALAAAGGSTGGGGSGTGGGGTTSDQVSNGPPFTSNAAWAQYAIQVLEGNGYDAGTVTGDLGLYLSGSQVTADQEDVINAAIAVAGYPPVAGPNGYPPAINVIGSKQGGGGGGSGSGSGSGNPPPGNTNAGRLTQPQNVRLVLQYTNSVRLQWDEVAGHTGYVVQAKQGGPNGQVVNGPFDTVLALANIGGLQPGTRYTALIWPSSAQIPGGPGSNQPHTEFSFATKSK